MSTRIVNKGTGAGGSNTNKYGLSYENLTDLKEKYTVICKSPYKLIKFDNCDKIFVKADKHNFYKFMKNYMNNDIGKVHGCKNPDECYIDEANKIIIYIEKKFQQCNGSICEKIQTAPFKKKYLECKFPTFKIAYVFCLSNWFIKNCKTDIDLLINYYKIPIFWGDNETYKDDIVTYIINYK